MGSAHALTPLRLNPAWEHSGSGPTVLRGRLGRSSEHSQAQPQPASATGAKRCRVPRSEPMVECQGSREGTLPQPMGRTSGPATRYADFAGTGSPNTMSNNLTPPRS